MPITVPLAGSRTLRKFADISKAETLDVGSQVIVRGSSLAPCSVMPARSSSVVPLQLTPSGADRLISALLAAP
jgi:hypothetical protein